MMKSGNSEVATSSLRARPHHTVLCFLKWPLRWFEIWDNYFPTLAGIPRLFNKSRGPKGFRPWILFTCQQGATTAFCLWWRYWAHQRGDPAATQWSVYTSIWSLRPMLSKLFHHHTKKWLLSPLNFLSIGDCNNFSLLSGNTSSFKISLRELHSEFYDANTREKSTGCLPWHPKGVKQ